MTKKNKQKHQQHNKPQQQSPQAEASALVVSSGKKRRRPQSQASCHDGGHGNNIIHSKSNDTPVKPRATSNHAPTVKPTSTMAQTTNNDNRSTSSSNDITSHAIQWLQSRKKSVPSTLLGTSYPFPLTDMDQILNALPDLRERERRALQRHVEKCIKRDATNDCDGAATKTAELDGSDGEYYDNDDDDDNGSNSGNSTVQLPKIEGGTWPSHVDFSNNYRWDDNRVPAEIKNKYVSATIATSTKKNNYNKNSQTSNQTKQSKLLRSSRPSKKVYIKKITDPHHPAHGEFGLYCALPSGLPPGAWILDYVGHITLGEHQDKSSDYVSDFGEASELACDANTYGNEARFLNDFRNTGCYPNVEFNTRRDSNGELRQGVFVKNKKDAKTIPTADGGGGSSDAKSGNKKRGTQGEFEGIKQHEELLVSYGKSYWRSRVGNLTDFVWRLPGQPPVANRSSMAESELGRGINEQE